MNKDISDKERRLEYDRFFQDWERRMEGKTVKKEVKKMTTDEFYDDVYDAMHRDYKEALLSGINERKERIKVLREEGERNRMMENIEDVEWRYKELLIEGEDMSHEMFEFTKQRYSLDEDNPEYPCKEIKNYVWEACLDPTVESTAYYRELQEADHIFRSSVETCKRLFSKEALKKIDIKGLKSYTNFVEAIRKANKTY